MHKIVPGIHPTGQYDPELDTILLPSAPKFKERAPLVFAHELGHSELKHGIGGSILSSVLQERDAWRFALSKLPPDEIDLDFLDEIWTRNLDEWSNSTDDERTLDFARKAKNEIMALARRKAG